MKVIAFYLPQYHPIKENNEWWGKGFTEWTNVSKARPLFYGHYQPQIPSDLGFYDLRLSETREAQAQLAREYGIDAFCYYHYWFNGKMLLEKPFNEVLQSGEPDHEFCLCWANENWTRRWDGMEQELLIQQDYGEYDPDEHMAWLSDAFKDKRYIKINNKPLFLIYRASDIPNLKETISAWRASVKKYGIEDIYICCANNSQNVLTDQMIIEAGFDAIYEFAPNLRDFNELLSVSSIPGLNIYSYEKLVEREMRKPLAVEIVKFPCVFPSWDNTPRRNNNATIIQNEDVSLYAKWLRNGIDRTQIYSPEEQLVFINAWNEWGEGCHLEPDLKNGRKFLEATKKVVDGINVGFEEFVETKYEHYNHRIKVQFNRPLYIWGTGVAGQRALDALLHKGVKLTGFIDGNSKKWGSELRGYPIFSKEILNVNNNDQKPFVIIASMYYLDIEPLLMEYEYHVNSDYAISIVNSSLDVSKSFFVINNSCFCNVCGYSKFVVPTTSEEDIEVCEKCGSMPNERMLIEILSEDLGAGSVPLSQWLNNRNVKLLNVESINEKIPFLNMTFDYRRVTSMEYMDMLDNEIYDYTLMILTVSIYLNKAQWNKVIGRIEKSIKTIILLDDIQCEDDLYNELQAKFIKVFRVRREYSQYKTGIHSIFIVDNFSDM